MQDARMVTRSDKFSQATSVSSHTNRNIDATENDFYKLYYLFVIIVK